MLGVAMTKDHVHDLKPICGMFLVRAGKSLMVKILRCSGDISRMVAGLAFSLSAWSREEERSG